MDERRLGWMEEGSEGSARGGRVPGGGLPSGSIAEKERLRDGERKEEGEREDWRWVGEG